MMERWISRRLRFVNSPEPAMRGRIEVHRFPKTDEDTFFLMKMIQVVSGLRASKVLIDNQFIYEWNLLARSIFEVIEDVICVLATQDNPNERTNKSREQLLRSFFVEDLDDHGKPSTNPIRAPSRERIRRAIREHPSIGPDLMAASTALYRMGSSILHGRASGIMQMFDQKSCRFSSSNVGGVAGIAISFDRHINFTVMILRVFGVIVGRWFGPAPYVRFFERAERLEREAQRSQQVLYSDEVRTAMEDLERD